MIGKQIIDDCLSTRNGHLFVEQCDVMDLVDKFGSPLFVISENQLRRNIRRYQNGFQKGWTDGPVKILPAAKANWILAVQKIIASEGCGCDIYSPGEFDIALRAEFDPQYISVNGVPKDEDHIYNAIKHGARITIDGAEEIDIVEKGTRELGKTAKVRLRLKPALPNCTRHSDFAPQGLVSTDIAAMAYKGGLAFDQVVSIGKRIMKSDRVELTGFHEHHGRHDPSTDYWKEQMRMYAREIGKVCSALGGYQPQEIDIGGGFACPRDPFNAATKYSDPFLLLVMHAASKALKVLGEAGRYRILNRAIEKVDVTIPNQKRAPTIEEYGEACTTTLMKELPGHGINTRGLMLQVEPGRSLHADAGIHLTTVKNIKRMQEPLKWNHLVLDTTEFWFTGGRLEHHLHDYLFANRTDSPLNDKADIVGRSCYGDRLIPAVPVPEDVKAGDIMAILDTGAYQEPSMSNFNAMPRPATLLVTDDAVSVIRQAETLADVFRRDLVPGHL
jgi:diaminopimelate decarboxylase